MEGGWKGDGRGMEGWQCSAVAPNSRRTVKSICSVLDWMSGMGRDHAAGIDSIWCLNG